jgi:AP-1-like transcription factor
MEKLQDHGIDIDGLCSELKAKARCTEGGPAMLKKDLDNILGSAK